MKPVDYSVRRGIRQIVRLEGQTFKIDCTETLLPRSGWKSAASHRSTSSPIRRSRSDCTAHGKPWPLPSICSNRRRDPLRRVPVGSIPTGSRSKNCWPNIPICRPYASTKRLPVQAVRAAPPSCAATLRQIRPARPGLPGGALPTRSGDAGRLGRVRPRPGRFDHARSRCSWPCSAIVDSSSLNLRCRNARPSSTAVWSMP